MSHRRVKEKVIYFTRPGLACIKVSIVTELEKGKTEKASTLMVGFSPVSGRIYQKGSALCGRNIPLLPKAGASRNRTFFKILRSLGVEKPARGWKGCRLKSNNFLEAGGFVGVCKKGKDGWIKDEYWCVCLGGGVVKRRVWTVNSHFDHSQRVSGGLERGFSRPLLTR